MVCVYEYLAEMVYRVFVNYRIVMLHSRNGYGAPSIAKILQKGECLSRRGIAKFIDRYKARGTVLRKLGTGKWAKITEEIKELVEGKMREDDETTAVDVSKTKRLE